MDLLHLYLTKYAKKASDEDGSKLDSLSSSAGMEPDSDTTDTTPVARDHSTGTRGSTAPTTRSSTVGTTGSTTAVPATGSSATGTTAVPATGSSATGTTGSTAAGPTSTSIVGATPLSEIPSMFLNLLVNEALMREAMGDYQNPLTYRNERLKSIDETAKTVLGEVFKELPEVDNPINRILMDERNRRAELMNRGARAILDSYAKYRASQTARGIVPRNPIAAEKLQQLIREERLANRIRNHSLAAQERVAHIDALKMAVRGLKGGDPVPSFDKVFDYARLIVPNTFGITGYPNKARANVVLKDLARYAALREDPDSEQIANGVAAALDRLKSGPVSQVGRERDEYIVRRGLQYLASRYRMKISTLRNVFGAGNSEYKDIVARVGLDTVTRIKLGL
jgi:hypothetical protein